MLLDRSRWAEKKGQREREIYSSIYAINGRRVGGKLRYLTLVGRSRWFVLLKLVQAILSALQVMSIVRALCQRLQACPKSYRLGLCKHVIERV